MSHVPDRDPNRPDRSPKERRGFLSKVSGIAMSLGLIGGYGAFGAIAGRYLYPASGAKKSWFFVAVLEEFKPGESIPYRSPSGAKVNITRKGPGLASEDFSALSSVCPHLGCQVHWEGQNNRYFCPCHNGTFDPEGVATGGPPKDANQSLPSFPLKVENGLLYVQVPTETLAELVDGGPTGPGHDPCLYRRFPSEEV